jgi:hypothetical protein
LERERSVALETLALSSISIWTVKMSPTLLARWSLKKARAPTRQSELAEAGWFWGAACIGNGPVCGARTCWFCGTSAAG